MDIKYGAKVQYAVTDTEPNLTLAQIKYIQQVTGKLLFYARAIDNTMLHTLNMITTMTITGTTATLDAANYLLNYAACNPNAEIRYSASNMILNIHSDAAYLVAPEAQSRAGGFHFLGTKNCAQFNGPLLVLARTIKNVMTSATESEISALFMNAREAIPIRRALINLGHQQPATPIISDNSTAVGIIKGTMKQKQSKSFNACRMKTQLDGMASGRSRSFFTAEIIHIKNHIIFRAGPAFLFFVKKDRKKAGARMIQPSNA